MVQRFHQDGHGVDSSLPDKFDEQRETFSRGLRQKRDELRVDFVTREIGQRRLRRLRQVGVGIDRDLQQCG